MNKFIVFPMSHDSVIMYKHDNLRIKSYCWLEIFLIHELAFKAALSAKNQSGSTDNQHNFF